MIEYVCITHVEITDPTEPKIPNSVMLQIPYVELVASKIWNGWDQLVHTGPAAATTAPPIHA